MVLKIMVLGCDLGLTDQQQLGGQDRGAANAVTCYPRVLPWCEAGRKQVMPMDGSAGDSMVGGGRPSSEGNMLLLRRLLMCPSDSMALLLTWHWAQVAQEHLLPQVRATGL